jgi:hypothetical protein
LPDWLLPDKERESATLSAEPEYYSVAAGLSARVLMLMSPTPPHNNFP